MTSRAGVSPLRRLYLRWRSIRLPWRKKFLVGSDLYGNTFWEFKDALNANRMRRIVEYGSKAHYGDIKVSPQWHQWLRHTRPTPPSLQEQREDVLRQTRVKELAKAADERWAAQESYLDAPGKATPQISQNGPETKNNSARGDGVGGASGAAASGS